MATDRRRFLLGAAALAGSSLLPSRAAVATAAHMPAINRFLSARADISGACSFAAMDGGATSELFNFDLPDRGHKVALSPTGHAVAVFARRPGTFLVVLDAVTGATAAQIESEPGRHFFGHGVFSADGSRLFSTENDIAGERGLIGVRDATDGYRKIAEWPTHGVEPHDILLLPDGATLAVANGGLLTRPETGRAKLNRATMAPSLVYVDAADGRLIAEHRLPPEHHQLSVRHLACAADGYLALTMQYEGPPGDIVPLAALHRPGEAIALLDGPAAALKRMRNYCGDAACDRTGRTIAASAPRGNSIAFWDLDSRRFLGDVALPDSCALAALPADDMFLITSGTGAVFAVNGRTGAVDTLLAADDAGCQWDNHVAVVV
jgi:hypothetical protein